MPILRALVCIAVTLIYVDGHAGVGGADEAHHSVLSLATVGQWLVSLLLVLAIFAGLAWLLRRSGTLTRSEKGQLSVIAGLSIGMRERLVLVRVGDKQLLLGVTPGRIDKLLELDGDARLFVGDPIAGAEGETFADKLQRLIQAKNHA